MYSDKEIKNQIIEKQKQIEIWNHAYFDNDDPLVEDAIYDKALLELKSLEFEYKHLFTEEELKNSPTNVLGSGVSSAFQKVTHKQPMLSLQKSYEKSEVERWINNILKVASEPSYFIEPKIDGLSIALKYKNGKLVQALTRGDGHTGEDVTHNVMTIEDVPKQINYKNDIEIRGEVYLKLSEFEKLNIMLHTEGKDKLANPRNAASGSLRQLNPEIAAKRHLSVFTYAIVDPEKHNIHTIAQLRSWLREHSFAVTEDGKVVKDINEIFKWIKDFKHIKTTLDYETDGIVIKLNEMKYYDLLGATQKFPRYAIAYKYEPNTATTLVTNIFTTVGRTGMITYNAALEPVFLGGSTISAATLHNYDYISKLNIDIGDLVYIKKAGEIIPKVISTVKQKTSTNFPRATACPVCGHSLVDSESGIDQYCINDNCPEVRLKQLIHFTSKNAMDIQMLGEKNIEIFYKMNLIREFKDIYNLKNHRQQLITIERFGEKSVDKILQSIEESKNKSLDCLLAAISIKLVGEKVAYFLASQILKFKNLLTFDFDTLIQYNEIGDKIVSSLKEFVADQKNVNMICDLCDLGLNLKYANKIESFQLMNLSFVITGTLSRPRAQIEKTLVSKGAKISNSVTKNTSYLVVGQNPGSKLPKAKALGIKIIDENQLYNEILND